MNFFDKSLIALMLIALSTNSFANTEKSTLQIPISIPLKNIQDLANRHIPTRLVTINEPRQVCVPAEWIKTKVPYITFEYKRVLGAKIKIPTTRTKWLKTKITPAIRCKIQGQIDRKGPVRIFSKNNRVNLSLVVDATVSAKKIAHLIKSQSARANATVTSSVSIDMDVNKHAKLTHFRG